MSSFGSAVVGVVLALFIAFVAVKGSKLISAEANAEAHLGKCVNSTSDPGNGP